MTTKKKRITISLSHSSAAFVERASRVLGKPQSAVVTDILDESVESLIPILGELERAKKGDISKSKLVSQVIKHATKATARGQIDLIDSFDDG